jgi:RNA polymerase sigma-70 factor (ECF subfamily)
MVEGKNNLENEAEIVGRAKTDDAAFEILYNHYFPKIYGYVFRRIGNREAAEDIVSNVFLKVFSNLKKYEDRGFTFGSWVYRIATNSLMDHYRRNKPGMEVELEEKDGENFSDNNQITSVEQKQDRAAIEKVLQKMPERYREIINLRFFAELEIEEIAVTLKISKPHASVLLHRALNKFKSVCGNDFAE